MKFKGDIIITDPCYVIRADHHDTKPITEDDWETCSYGSDMQSLGFSNNYLCNDTIYGDWSCTTYEKGTDKVLGEFCADAGLVSVFLLSEVLKYNPDFDYHIEKPWTTTLIKDFDGDIIAVTENDELHLEGKGNINFYTAQTGL